MTASADTTTRVRNAVTGAGLLAGNANVIMQLARPGVGYGVVESRVESGQLFRHPIKRTRTTLAYIAVATMGTARERELFRRGVNRAHAQVRSTDSSPVAYNAFDPDLQLWVAACLFKGFEDLHLLFFGEPDAETAEAFYRDAAALGTTLQVPPEAWPSDRAAFEQYWTESLGRIAIDDAVREYLLDVTMLTWLPRPVSVLLGRFNRFVTAGFLPEPFRAEMRLPWTARDQRRFDRLMAVVAAIVRHSPPVLRQFPYNLILWDLRRRIRTGRPLV
ncbi:oxygenase MpaB family protein [Saccharopolyspora indica]|uniref:oxygenase MpaB family protein n=1 Tax=Saccharopolyspora indica TaxID=1229659 RepID=UPI0022EAEDFD|nr:oxygenase MpaB family protein [Saccharopolyspora indica]MDA3644423.1 oxygenase MpaB family protein [Saccharopolyspora indica]